MEGLKKDDPDMFLPTFNDLMGNDESMRKMMIDSQSSFIKTSGKVLISNYATFIDFALIFLCQLGPCMNLLISILIISDPQGILQRIRR